MPANLATQIKAGSLDFAFHGRADHVKRYLARVDERLTELPNDECRRGFLGDELAKWQFRYSTFTAKVDRGLETSPEVSAYDFLDTMGELDMRIGRLSRSAA
jgi:hypothetical protein